MRSPAARAPGPAGLAAAQVGGTSGCCPMAAMKPATGLFAPATAANIAGPLTRRGQPPPFSAKSSHVAREGANVLVSC
ncbi:hypothetical protein G6F68_011700 [Rhizopus microsporus]|nr:hypothetical protein G6F68_011700 [Rhizopus microsporus]